MGENSILKDSDLIKDCLCDLHDGAFIDDEDLQELLAQAWLIVVPEECHEELSQESFVSACFKNKEKYLVALNGEYNAANLSLAAQI